MSLNSGAVPGDTLRLMFQGVSQEVPMHTVAHRSLQSLLLPRYYIDLSLFFSAKNEAGAMRAFTFSQSLFFKRYEFGFPELRLQRAFQSEKKFMEMCCRILCTCTNRFTHTAGLFMAPTLVGEAMKGGMLLRKVLSNARHDVLSPCIVHTQCRDSTRDSGPERPAVHLPGASACMGSTDAMHAMLRAVEDCACMPAAPEAPLPQTLVSSAPSSHGDENPRRSVQQDADKKKLAGGYKVRTFISMHAPRC